jgi:hypothetical protein
MDKEEIMRKGCKGVKKKRTSSKALERKDKTTERKVTKGRKISNRMKRKDEKKRR